jgi:hypothetical protein
LVLIKLSDCGSDRGHSQNWTERSENYHIREAGDLVLISAAFQARAKIFWIIL